METDKPKTSVRLSRAELYEQVWKTPLMHLGPQYGITGTGLAKICDRLNVPYPPAGYWLKAATGQPGKNPPLPPAGDRIPENVRISPTPDRPEIAPEFQAKFAEALLKYETLRVPDLRRPHQVVAAYMADHARSVADSKRAKREWGSAPHVEPLTGLDHRKHRILDTILKEAEKIGFKVSKADTRDTRRELQLKKGDDAIEVSLTEYIRQVRRPLRPEERHRFNLDQQWTQEKIRTGDLQFRIWTYLGPGVRLILTDDPDDPLESRIGEILATLIVGISILENDRLAAEKRQRTRLEAESRRQQEANRRRVEAFRWRRFLEFANRWVDSDRARRFITAIEALGLPEAALHGGRSHDEWLAWVKERLDSHDPLGAGINAIWSNMARVMPDEYRD